MKKLLLLSFFAITAFISNAQHDMSTDKSKMPSPPAATSVNIGGTSVEITYHQPGVKGRNVWEGNLAPYGKVWRTGANEATTFEISKDVLVQGKELKAGKYGLFSIPGEKEWTIIFNKVSKQWGAFSYKESEDVLRVTATPKAHDMTERFTIQAADNGEVTLLWDKVAVTFTVK
jgi:hypothetical protein